MEDFMRSLRCVAVLGICVLGLSLLALARQNQFGVSDVRNLELVAPTRIGGVLMPQGDYRVSHSMEGQDHIMVFHQLRAKKPAEVRVKCQLVPLPKKAERDEQAFQMNAANERVLHTLIFRGDSAQHVF
jgi:hypothetical protein